MAEGPETHTSTSSTINSSSQDSSNHQTQVPTIGGLNTPNSNIPFLPFTYPALVPGLSPPNNDQEQTNRGPGLYAVQVHPFMQPIAGFASNNLIPLTYNIPTSTAVREVGGEQGQPGEQPQQQLQAGPDRDVVWRFQIAIPVDLFLILRLAAVVFLFNDGSKQRLTLLVCFAILFYLYQTGVLAPVIRRLSQRMQRAAALPQPPRAAVRGNNLPAAGAQGNENGGIAGAQPVGENENRQSDEGNRETENEHAEEPGQREAQANRWWGIVKEVQIIVFGFIASLLPGYHND